MGDDFDKSYDLRQVAENPANSPLVRIAAIHQLATYPPDHDVVYTLRQVATRVDDAPEVGAAAATYLGRR